jgi:hypothetical protein
MKDEDIVTQPAIARLVQSGGKLIGLEEECLKVCEQIGSLTNKKLELGKEVEEVTSLLNYLRNECSWIQRT